MKTIRKAVLAVAVLGVVFIATSCQKHTCPTYSKANTTTEVKA